MSGPATDPILELARAVRWLSTDGDTYSNLENPQLHHRNCVAVHHGSDVAVVQGASGLVLASDPEIVLSNDSYHSVYCCGDAFVQRVDRRLQFWSLTGEALQQVDLPPHDYRHRFVVPPQSSQWSRHYLTDFYGTTALYGESGALWTAEFASAHGFKFAQDGVTLAACTKDGILLTNVAGEASEHKIANLKAGSVIGMAAALDPCCVMVYSADGPECHHFGALLVCRRPDTASAWNATTLMAGRRWLRCQPIGPDHVVLQSVDPIIINVRTGEFRAFELASSGRDFWAPR